MANTLYTYVMQRKVSGKFLIGRGRDTVKIANDTSDLAKATHRKTEKQAIEYAAAELGGRAKYYVPVKIAHTLSVA